MQTIRPASHTTALGELFIADEWAGVQAKVSGVASLVHACSRRVLNLPDQDDSSGLQLEFLLAHGRLCAMGVRHFQPCVRRGGNLLVQPSSALHPVGPLINVLGYLIELSIEPSGLKHHLAPPISFVLRLAVDFWWEPLSFLSSHSFDP